MIVMNKAELYARYELFGQEIQEIDHKEFYQHYTEENRENILSTKETESTYSTLIRLDGCDYYMFSSTYNVGWQGDVDCDTFFCKKETITRAEMLEMEKLFTSDVF